MDELFDEYHIPLLNNLVHPSLIEEWTRNIDSDAYKKIKPRCKSNIKEEEN